MKNRSRLFICLMVPFFLMVSSCTTAETNKSSETSSSESSSFDINAIYQEYVNNGGSLSFEDWLAIIKTHGGSTAGDELHVGTNGNWWVGNEDTGISALINYVPCIFNNYDGTKLYEYYFEKGTDAVYRGVTPTRETEYDGEEALPYTFIGWDKSLTNIQQPTTFTAQYRWKMYNVTFKNYDNTTLYSTQVERGRDATYIGVTPTREDSVHDWTFAGWNASLANVKSDMTYYAQFYAPDGVKCTFKNYDGSTLSTQYVGNGEKVTYLGPVPTRSDDNEEGYITRYEFTGWDKSLNNLTEDTVFTAQYGANSYYEVKFVNYNDTLLYTTSTFNGGQVKYIGEKPAKPQEVSSNNVVNYTFTGWDKPLTNISAPTTIKATYSSENYTGYLVRFLDRDSTELYSHYYKEGTDAIYPYDTPFSYDSDDVHTFVGWSGSIKNIVAPVTVTAQYLDIDREQNGEYPQSVVTDEALITSLNTLTTQNAKGYYEYGGEQYEKVTAHPSTFTTTFDNGDYIVGGNIYYFKVEPIKWRYLSDDGNTAFMTSEYILDRYSYDQVSSNYKESAVRTWLNSDFLNKAFDDNSLVAVTAVDNSVASTMESSNPNVCETTYDKIFLLSMAELHNADYGFSTSKTDHDIARSSKTSEYARANSVWACMDLEDYMYCGSYLTRSPSGTDASYVNRIRYDGYGLDAIKKYSTSAIRPALSFQIA